MQGVSVRALPLVKEVRFYPRFQPNDNTNVTCPTPLAFTFTTPNGEVTTIRTVISPLDKPDYVERELSASLEMAGINTRIHVAVEFSGDEGRNASVGFSFVFLTPLSQMSLTPPEISIETYPSNISCTNLNNDTDPIDDSLLEVRAEVNTVQDQMLPTSFKIGYDDLAIMPGMRFTDGLPISTSTDSLEEAVFDLFGWECNNQPRNQLLEQLSAYQTYEDSTGDKVDVSTSFCGHNSLRNPARFWQVSERDAFAIGNSPFFVSTLIDF